MLTPTNFPIRKQFDYSSLDAVDAVFVQQQTGVIQSLMKRSVQDILEIGQRLIAVKKRLGHGRFSAWLGVEFDWDERTAQRFMNVTVEFGSKSDKLSELNLAPSALYILAAPSTSEAARREAIARAEVGESITHKAAKEIKQKYSPSSTRSKFEPSKLQPEVKPQAESAVESQLRSKKSEPDAQLLPQSTSTAAPVPEPAAVLPGSQADISALALPHLRQRATGPSQPKVEVMAICPKAEAAAVVETQEMIEAAEAPPKKPTPRFVQPGSWWQVGEEHLLYCGDPLSSRFRERLPKQVALSLAFPPSWDNWPQTPSNTTCSALAWYTCYREDQDLQLLRDSLRGFLLLSTEGGDSVVFSFLPDPGMLLLAHELECHCLCAEPDPVRCEAVIAAWREKGLKAEKVIGLRF